MVTVEQRKQLDNLYQDVQNLIQNQSNIEQHLFDDKVFNEHHRFQNLVAVLNKSKAVSPHLESIINNHMSSLNSFMHSVEDFFNDHYQTNIINIAIAKAKRKAEREDMFILWGQRLLRWVVTVSIAILLYSLLVFISEHWTFIKIPVRDFFH